MLVVHQAEQGEQRKKKLLRHLTLHFLVIVTDTVAVVEKDQISQERVHNLKRA